LWEIYTYGCFPYPCIKPQDLLNLIKTGYRLEKPDDCLQQVYDIMFFCWSLNPSERPNFKEIVKKLDEYFNLKDYKSNSQIVTEKPECIVPIYHHNSTSSKYTSSRISSSSFCSESDVDSQSPKCITTSFDEAEDVYFDDSKVNEALIESNSTVKLREELKPFLNHYNNNFKKEIEKNQYSML
jgi:hypothetical protein